MPEYTNLSDVIVDGRIESSAQGGVMGSFAVMPTASALNENCIVLYTGTTGTYVSGRFYMCVESGGSYSWQPVTISGTEAPVFTASRALVSDSLGAASASSVTATELAYLSGLTGNLVTLLNGKVDKVSGMGLSQNSYTTDEKNKLAGIAAGAEVNVISAVQNNGVPVEVVGKTVNITHPTLLSQFTNDTGFITSTVANLQNYYDKATVNDMISAIPKFAISVVAQLPSSGQSATTIYLTPKDGSSGDVYDEYLYVNNAWEKIGSTAVQFSFDQSGTDILINGTAIRSASSSQSGVMTTAQVSELTTATSNITNLQSQYSSLNGTVSSLSSRLDTAESTLSTTASRVTTCENNTITSGQTVDNTLQLNQQGGGRIDIPLPESTNVFFTNISYQNVACVPLSYLTEVSKAPNKRLTKNSESTKINNLYSKYSISPVELSSESTMPESPSYLVDDISSFIKQGAGTKIWGMKDEIYYLNDTGSTVLSDIPYLEITNCASYSSASERVYIEGDGIAMCNILIRIRDGYVKLKTLKESYADSPPDGTDYISFGFTNESKAIAHDTIPW